VTGPGNWGVGCQLGWPATQEIRGMSKKRVPSEEIMLQVRTGRLTTAGLCGTPAARSGSASSQIPGGSTVDGE